MILLAVSDIIKPKQLELFHTIQATFWIINSFSQVPLVITFLDRNHEHIFLQNSL